MSASPIFLPSTPTTPSETWLPYPKALTLCARTGRWFSQQIREERITVRASAHKLPNGRFDREVLLASLPAAAQQRYQQELAKLGPETRQLPLFGRPQLVTDAPRVHTPEAKLSDAEARQQILAPILAMRQAHAKAIYAASLRLADGRPVTSENRMMAYQVEQARERGEALSVRTLKRWLAAYTTDNGVAGLARRQRKDAGRSRFFDRPENARAAALLAYLSLGDGMRPGLNAQACYEMLAVQREQVGLARLDLPHYDTVRAFLASITPALRVFALKGRQEFNERMMPYITRAHEEPSNAIWVSDTMISDVEVLNDCIAGAPRMAPVRLRLTAVIDYRSRFLVGYSWAWEGSSASITTAIRHAVTKHGPCELWYCDNGKDYVKTAKAAVPGYMQPGSLEAEDWVEREMRTIENTGVLARLGIQVTRCLVHHPQSKHVERFFRTLHGTFCRLWQTYTGGKPSERPDQTAALMHDTRQKIRHGKVERSHHPLASEYMAAFEPWLRLYHAKRHRGQGMQGRSPAEVFAAERNPKQRPAPAAQELAVLLWEHTNARVLECQVRVNKHDYVAPAGDPYAARLMLDRCETYVAVAYDPLDPAQVAILDADGRLVTMLEAKRLVRQAPDDPATQAQIAAMQQQRGTMVRELREDRLAVVRAGKQLGVLHPLDLLAAAAPTSAPVIEALITPRKPNLYTPPVLAGAPKSPRQVAAEMHRLQQESAQ